MHDAVSPLLTPRSRGSPAELSRPGCVRSLSPAPKVGLTNRMARKSLIEEGSPSRLNPNLPAGRRLKSQSFHGDNSASHGPGILNLIDVSNPRELSALALARIERERELGGGAEAEKDKEKAKEKAKSQPPRGEYKGGSRGPGIQSLIDVSDPPVPPRCRTLSEPHLHGAAWGASCRPPRAGCYQVCRLSPSLPLSGPRVSSLGWLCGQPCGRRQRTERETERSCGS